MKKLFWIVFLLSGCMTAPQKTFQVDPDTEVFQVQANEVIVIPMTTHFDMLPHVENKMPTSPEEAISEWAKMHLKATSGTPQKLVIVIEQADVLKADLPSGNLFKPDEEHYTLNYKITLHLRQEGEILKTVPVAGKGFVTVAKKAALSTKEKGWAWLIQKMLTHLKIKMKSDLQNVFTE